MLNISKGDGKELESSDFNSIRLVKVSRTSRVLRRGTVIFVSLGFLILLLPWTQNIRSRGYVTSLRPDERPQNIHSIIPGQIKEWYIKEGDYVVKGDTIVKISEVKSEYFDPDLLLRTNEQVNAKEGILIWYDQKVSMLDEQERSLRQMKKLKLAQSSNYIKQAELTIISDSIDLEAAKADLEIAEKQLVRTNNLFVDGLKSLTDLETKKLKVQETKASKKISAENKLLTSRNKLINSRVGLATIQNEYEVKITKVSSEKYSALSAKYESEGDLSKMKSTLGNYKFRKDQYYILAPQSGFITKVLITGVGETVKEGESLVSIMPGNYDLAVEMYVRPVDLPLIKVGQKIRFMFDGWPSIVFSGWPTASYGTFGGKVVAVDNFISENGKYRILVAEDEDEPGWPTGLRIGAGADGMALLHDVQIWYEMWRNMNGFPQYYEGEPNHNKAKNIKSEK